MSARHAARMGRRGERQRNEVVLNAGRFLLSELEHAIRLAFAVWVFNGTQR